MRRSRHRSDVKQAFSGNLSVHAVFMPAAVVVPEVCVIVSELSQVVRTWYNLPEMYTRLPDIWNLKVSIRSILAGVGEE